MSSRAEGLRIETDLEGGQPTVRIAGEVDLSTSPQLHPILLELIDRRPQRVILDLSGVSYMDSSGVGTLVDFKRRLDRTGGRVILAGLQPRVRSVFEITQLHRFFTIADDVDQARSA